MTSWTDIIIPAAVLVGGYIILSRLTALSTDAGKWVAQNVIQPSATVAKYPTAAALGFLEGYSAPEIPATPAGYAPSNWTWDIGGGVKLGLPEGTTPGQFCAANPSAPVCASVQAKPSIISEWYKAVW